MKKVLYVLVVTSLPLIAVNSSEYSFLSKKTEPVVQNIPTIEHEHASVEQPRDTAASLLPSIVVAQDDAVTDEYEEYEQHVCDNAQQPAVSPTMAYLREVGCSLLIRYLVLKEQAGKYFTSAKNSIGKMLGLIA